MVSGIDSRDRPTGKSLLMHGHNVSETAHLLVFEYVHHFNRIFKKVTGHTPSEFLAK